MEYRVVPKTGDKISILGYGCMRFPSRLGRIDESKATQQIKYAIDQGVNYFDTAYPYHNGESESFLGKVFSDKKLRSKVKIATKLPPWSVKTREDMTRILDEQLKKLQVDSIDYYLVHGIMGLDVWERMKGLGVLEFLDDAQKQGKIRHVGFSVHCDLETFKIIVDDYDWAMCQIQYNYLDEYNQVGREGLEYAYEKDIAVFVMEPLRGGSLTGKIPKPVAKIWSSAPIERSPAEWAFKWLYNHKEVTSVLSGMNVDAHIQENIKIAGETKVGSLTSQENQTIYRARDVYKTLTKVPCTACSYCMPCPVGVNIPLAFEKYNDKYMFGTLGATAMYQVQLGAVMGDNETKASLCVDCGKCESHCPQHIEIRKELKKVTKELDGFTGKTIQFVAKRFMNRSNQ